jgi:hypothetical protein
MFASQRLGLAEVFSLDLEVENTLKEHSERVSCILDPRT